MKISFRTAVLSLLLFSARIGFIHAQTTSSPASSLDYEQVPWGITTSASSMGACGVWYPKMAAAGIHWARMFPEWNGIEKQKGKFDYEFTDKMVASAAANNIEISGMLFGKCPWGPGGMHAFPMQNLDDWSDYAAEIANHFKGKIHYWEVWNEGNAGFNDGKNGTADYANLVAAAYSGVKRSDPTALVGMSVASFDPAYVDVAAMDQAAAGKGGSFDYICIHPYETFGGIDSPDGEVPYLWMSHLLRDALKADAPDKANVPIWITEVGRPVGKTTNDAGLTLGMKPDELDAAKAVVKAYTMALAQGISRICWFEANDPDPRREPGGYGLIDFSGKPRPSYTAMKAMTASLGETPKYLGWLALGTKNRCYGFAFQGARGPVLVAWTPAGVTDNTITFSKAVEVVDPLTNTATMLESGHALALTSVPVFVLGLPDDLVAQAQANAAKNFPWGGDYSKATVVSNDLGKSTGYNGVYGPGKLPVHQFADGTAGVVVQGNIGSSASFTVHPSFAGIKQKDYYVRISFRRIGPGNVGMNFKYEVADSQGKGPLRHNGGWYRVADDPGWQTYTWHVTDACFAKMWDFDFSVNPEQSVPFCVGKVEVSTQPFADN
jgi:hypothetical protein